MNKSSYIHPKFDLHLEKSPKNAVSYSQFALYQKCPLSWKLAYIDKLREKDSTIHTVFGDAMHDVIQQWLRVMYTESIKASNALDLRAMLLANMQEMYAKAVDDGSAFSSKEELAKFYLDGAETLQWLKRHRTRFFSPREEILIGTEVPLVIEHNGIWFTAYLDAVRQHKVTKKIFIDDFKTSDTGWNDWTKNDSTKTSQLILYKIFFARQYNVPIESIDVEYIILKRTIKTDSTYPEKRVQRFKPSQAKPSCNKVQAKFDQFLQSCFLPDGSYNTDREYQAISGQSAYHCTFCRFRDDFARCPLEKRIQF